jgi:hypothetical protein
MKNLTLKQVIKLEYIIRTTKKKRIKYKLIKRISNGTFNYFLEWLKDKKSHQTIDRVKGGVRKPHAIELIKRYS